MRDIVMLATVPNTTAGLLREGKPYHVADDLADRLIKGGYAREVTTGPEAAVRSAPEHAARRVGGRLSARKRRPPEAASPEATAGTGEADDA